MTENLVDLHYIENTRAASANVRAAEFTLNSAKETVTLAVAASYLLVIAAESQVEAATAELNTAEALQQFAEDREAAGLNPNIDTLRARVELQVRRQNLIEANNNLAKQRIALLRVLGLPDTSADQAGQPRPIQAPAQSLRRGGVAARVCGRVPTTWLPTSR